MKSRAFSLTRPASRPRGGSLFIAMVMLGIMSIAILAMLQYAMYQQRMTHRRVEREAVYYAAEAGVDQVVHYFNFPTEYQPDPDLFERDPATLDYSFSLPMTLASSTASPLIFGYEAGDGENRAQVTDLTISSPTAEESAAFDDVVLAVTSQGQNAAGQTRIVRATLTAEPPFLLKIPAPLISFGGYEAKGQFNIHWGEAWFKDDFSLPNGGLNGMPSADSSDTDYDPWFNLKTEGTVLLNNGTPAPSGTALDPSDPNYYQPWLGIDSDHVNIWQHAPPPSDPPDPMTISFPDPLDYEFWKDVAQSRGLYFSWNADGTRLVQGTNGAEIRVGEFVDMINGADDVVIGADGESQTLPPPQIVFVDTLDGNPPAADGSNLCSFTGPNSLTGGGETFLRGVFFICGDVDLGLRGMQNIWLQDPDRVADPNAGTETQETIFLNGLFYTEGLLSSQGSLGVYGALFTGEGFAGNGGWDVWYDARLGEGLPLSINSAVRVARQVELSPDVEIAGL